MRKMVNRKAMNSIPIESSYSSSSAIALDPGSGDTATWVFTFFALFADANNSVKVGSVCLDATTAGLNSFDWDVAGVNDGAGTLPPPLWTASEGDNNFGES